MILRITYIGFLAGILGTLLGGVISLIFRKKADRYLDMFMGLSGGVMLAVVAFDLISEAINQSGMVNTIIFAFIGAIFTYFIKSLFRFDGILRSGYLIFVCILMHNFPEGLAIGSSFLLEESLGITLAIVIGLHNIPEGVAMSLSLIKGKMSTVKVILFAFIAGLPMGIGSFIGAHFANLFSEVIGMFLAMAAGTMLYTTLDEIFPRSKSIYSVIGFLIGMVIVNM
ncbi:ZIP family metal transporter [Alkalithermobacter paradoxus]|uniref:Zinc transporter ZupT n=1 Tax=Alkalithermobacter paradoxus TaxID=29349 RepID=A0A1V4I6Q2_9FIRM|nr:zinc transporter ZupT [[Clostridium] thermoalcaliphilum]